MGCAGVEPAATRVGAAMMAGQQQQRSSLDVLSQKHGAIGMQALYTYGNPGWCCGVLCSTTDVCLCRQRVCSMCHSSAAVKGFCSWLRLRARAAAVCASLAAAALCPGTDAACAVCCEEGWHTMMTGHPAAWWSRALDITGRPCNRSLCAGRV